MSKSYALKTKITIAIAFALLLIVLLISLLSNVFINKKFVDYISNQRMEKTAELVASLSQQYNPLTRTWDLNFIHTIGMYALYDGYIIRVDNMDALPVWDAQAHDMTACAHIMEDIKNRMETKYPSVNGGFVSEIYPLLYGGNQIGNVEISYFGPFFLSENDFDFLDTLNTVLVSITALCLVVSVLLGRYLANWISKPILKAVEASGKIAVGNYQVRVEEKTTIKELNQLIESMNFLSQTLDRQENLRKQLTADVAHELRTPLTTVATHIEAMIEGIWEPAPERLKSCFEEIERISKLVVDLERLAKVEGDTLHFHKQNVDCLGIVEKVASALSVEMKDKEISCCIKNETTDTIVFGDAGRLYQLFYNLLTNAVKYTPEKGRICIRIMSEGMHINIAVKDSGIGIAEEDLPYIFERFYRTEKSRNRATGGSGIGLAIVKAIVAAHEGAIAVTSKQGKGSCFTVSLKRKVTIG